jgi:hypothetical protein
MDPIKKMRKKAAHPGDPGSAPTGLIEPGYAPEEALDKLGNDFSAIAAKAARRPPGVSPFGYVMLEVARHPDRQQKRNFPINFLAALKLHLAGVIRRVVAPRRPFSGQGPGIRYTTSLAVLAKRNHLATLPAKIRAMEPSAPAAWEMTCLESASVVAPESRLFLDGEEGGAGRAAAYEALLLPLPRRDDFFPLGSFTRLASGNGFKIMSSKKLEALGYLSVLLTGPRERLLNLAEFSLIWCLTRPGAKMPSCLRRPPQALQDLLRPLKDPPPAGKRRK